MTAPPEDIIHRVLRTMVQQNIRLVMFASEGGVHVLMQGDRQDQHVVQLEVVVAQRQIMDFLSQCTLEKDLRESLRPGTRLAARHPEYCYAILLTVRSDGIEMVCVSDQPTVK